MKKYITIAFIAFCLYSDNAHAAKAAAVVTSSQSSGNTVQIQVTVTEDSGQLFFSTTLTINFTSSTNQLNADIKQRVKDELTRMGITITVNDIFNT